MLQQDYNTTGVPALSLPPAEPCPRCAHPGPHQYGPGAGPHYQRLVCGQCQRFLKWIAKPRQQEVQP